MIFWIVGLSGSGKTTLASSLYKNLVSMQPNTIWLDGDNFRKFVDNKAGYSVKERKKLFEKTYSFIKFCYSQNLNVIVSILRFDKNIEKKNRKNFKNYYQIHLNSNIQTLIKRDSKGIYSNALKKRKPNLVGYDIKWNSNLNSHMNIKDFFNLKKTDVNKITKKILKNVKSK